jgi:hypothetical protein
MRMVVVIPGKCLDPSAEKLTLLKRRGVDFWRTSQGDEGERIDSFPPNQTNPAAAVEVCNGASGRVPAAEAERPLPVSKAALRP